MPLKILRFELRLQLRQPLFWILCLGSLAVGLALASSDIGVQIHGGHGIGLRNAPIVVLRLMPVVSLLALFPMAALIGGAALRDLELDAISLFLSKPIEPVQYLLGRFGGAMLLSLGMLLCGVAGLFASNFMPWQPAARLGPVEPWSYLYGSAVIIVPNLLIMGSMLFAVAAWSRRQTAVYLAAALMIAAQDVTEALAFGLHAPLLSSLLEPSSVVAIEMVTRFWTMTEQARLLPPVLGPLGANRLLWMGLALGLLLVGVRRFSVQPAARRRTRRASASLAEAGRGKGPSIAPQGAFRKPLMPPAWRQFLVQTRLELSEVVARAPFLVLSLFGLIFVLVIALNIGSHDGIAAYPRTEYMLRAINMAGKLILPLMLIIYAGELVHSQRQLRIADLYDASPVANLTLLAAKLTALLSIAVLFLGCAGLLTVLLQLARGYYEIAPGQYLIGLALALLAQIPVLAIALTVQLLMRHKLTALLVSAGLIGSAMLLPRLGWEDTTYRVATVSELHYSAFAGYGPYLKPYLVSAGYWLGWSMAAVWAAWLLWPRGRDAALLQRLREGRRWLNRGNQGALAVALLLVAVSGGWWIKATRIDHTYLDKTAREARAARYEQQYRVYAGQLLPSVAAVSLDVALYPGQRGAHLRGRYQLSNHGDQPISRLPFTLSPQWVEGALPVTGGIELTDLQAPGHRMSLRDDDLGFYVLESDQPLAPGAGIEVTFEVEVDHRQFRNGAQNFLLLNNGSFFASGSLLPILGYAAGNELQDPKRRSHFQLPPLRRAAVRGDPVASMRSYIDADWIDWDATISTASDQIVIAPGKLLREWREGDRRYFHFRSEQPLSHLLPIISARYQVRREHFEGVDIELYFDPAHAVNIDRFLQITKASLHYLGEHFGPYPHEQLRIAEIPGYHGRIAFSFAQVIAFSESWGYSLDLSEADYDPLAAVLTHEVAHQWWNHQLLPADTQGATFIAETLCQYAAAMIMRQLGGEAAVDRFSEIHRELYLRGRSAEQIAEMPLAQVENQGYVHYGKGPLA
ncbi:MAG: hypothetical protein KDI71_05755, partial [Xanthomonadales bacterium]|nr:hypothetical protein [Xanthomonadales bacterium]